MFDETIAILTGFAFLAGFIDAIVGGGGLIQLPALFVFGAGWPHTVALGTNKFSSIAGTTVALIRYLRSVRLDGRLCAVSAVIAILGSAVGAHIVSLIHPDFFRPLVIVMLIFVAIYTWRKKTLGGEHAPKFHGGTEIALACAVALALGFYDGFFGPGTGTFLIFLYVGVFGYNFLVSSAYAKVVNMSTNVGALAYFIATGNVNYRAAIPMACAQILGGYLGAGTAIKRGAGFVRMLFLFIVTLLIIRLITLELSS